MPMSGMNRPLIGKGSWFNIQCEAVISRHTASLQWVDNSISNFNANLVAVLMCYSKVLSVISFQGAKKHFPPVSTFVSASGKTP